MRTRIPSSFLLALVLALPAHAGPLLVTPSLRISSNGELECWVTNVSAKKTVEVAVSIRSFTGTVLADGGDDVPPLTANGLTSDSTQARFCVVEVLKGGKKNVRVTLLAMEDGVPAASVSADR